MPKSEKALEKKVAKDNTQRNHHRPLHGNCSYQSILGINLADECIKLFEAKKSTVRILDVGCGDGYALYQLKTELEEKGYTNQFEFKGLGINKYDKMHICDDCFLNMGLLEYDFGTNPNFDLIFSVYTFQYIWHKLEGIEKIYNTLLSKNGLAFIHFPGYLISLSEKTESISRTEKEGNQLFIDYYNKWAAMTNNTDISYKLIPFDFDEDDDDVITTELGILQINKKSDSPLAFNATLKGFAVFKEGFVFDMSIQGLSYISSYYDLDTDKWGSLSKTYLNEPNKLPLYRILTLKKFYQYIKYGLHLAIHTQNKPVIIGIYPAAKEHMTGDSVPYRQISEILINQNIGAVVRCNGLYTDEVNFHDFNDYFIHTFMDFIINNAEEICQHKNPDIYLIGYSSGGSAIASIAAEYNQIKKVLLLAPSYDSDLNQLTDNLNSYTGELSIICANDDQVVYPSEVSWFYFQALMSKNRKFVKLDNCDHDFNGDYNKEIVLKSPLWAFNGLSDFPEAELLSEKVVRDTYTKPEAGYR